MGAKRVCRRDTPPPPCCNHRQRGGRYRRINATAAMAARPPPIVGVHTWHRRHVRCGVGVASAVLATCVAVVAAVPPAYAQSTCSAYLDLTSYFIRTTLQVVRRSLLRVASWSVSDLVGFSWWTICIGRGSVQLLMRPRFLFGPWCLCAWVAYAHLRPLPCHFPVHTMIGRPQSSRHHPPEQRALLQLQNTHHRQRWQPPHPYRSRRGDEQHNSQRPCGSDRL